MGFGGGDAVVMVLDLGEDLLAVSRRLVDPLVAALDLRDGSGDDGEPASAGALLGREGCGSLGWEVAVQADLAAFVGLENHVAYFAGDGLEL